MLSLTKARVNYGHDHNLSHFQDSMHVPGIRGRNDDSGQRYQVRLVGEIVVHVLSMLYLGVLFIGFIYGPCVTKITYLQNSTISPSF